MKKFQEVLSENSIYMPRTPLRRLIFERRWEPIETDYRKACNSYRKTREEWESRYRDTFSKHWGRTLNYEDLVPFVVPRFSNLKEAHWAVGSIRFPYASDLYYEVEAKERKEWVTNLLKTAQNKGYRMVVVKGEYTPSAESEATFRTNVASGKESYISYVFSPAWVAFRADTDMSSVDFRCWLIYAKTAKVEFVK